MTQTEAQAMVSAFFAAVRIRSAGLSAKGYGGAAVDATPIAFEFETEVLRCLAVIFRFKEPAAPKVLEQLRAYDRTQGLSDAQGKLVYDEQTHVLAVERMYSTPSSDFARELMELVRRAMLWTNEGIFEAMK